MIKRGDKYPWRYWIGFAIMAVLELFDSIDTFPGSTSEQLFFFHWPWWLFFLCFLIFAGFAYNTFTANKPLTDKTTLKP